MSYLLLENGARLLLENGGGVLIADADVDPPLGECGDDLMARGMAWLNGSGGMLMRHLSQPVVYRRGSVAVALCATVGQKLLKLNDGEGGVVMEWTDADFLIPTADLLDSEIGGTPQRGDTVKQLRNGVYHTYEVLAPGGEPPWRYSDPYQYMLRIHAKLVKTEAAT